MATSANLECDLPDEGPRTPSEQICDHGRQRNTDPLSREAIVATNAPGPYGPSVDPAIPFVASMKIDPEGIRIGEIAHLDLRRGIEMGKAKHCNRRDTRIVSFDQGSE